MMVDRGKNMGFRHLARVDWLEIHGFFVENGERVRKNMVNEREKYCLCRELDPEIRFE